MVDSLVGVQASEDEGLQPALELSPVPVPVVVVFRALEACEFEDFSDLAVGLGRWESVVHFGDLLFGDFWVDGVGGVSFLETAGWVGEEAGFRPALVDRFEEEDLTPDLLLRIQLKVVIIVLFLLLFGLIIWIILIIIPISFLGEFFGGSVII